MDPFPSLNFLQMLFSDRMFLRDAAEESHGIKKRLFRSVFSFSPSSAHMAVFMAFERVTVHFLLIK